MERLCKFRRPGRARLNSTREGSHEKPSSEERPERQAGERENQWQVNAGQVGGDEPQATREMMRQMQSEDLNLEVVHPHAAGIDIGNAFHCVAVSRAAIPNRCDALVAPPPS